MNKNKWKIVAAVLLVATLTVLTTYSTPIVITFLSRLPVEVVTIESTVRSGEISPKEILDQHAQSLGWEWNGDSWVSYPAPNSILKARNGAGTINLWLYAGWNISYDNWEEANLNLISCTELLASTLGHKNAEDIFDDVSRALDVIREQNKLEYSQSYLWGELYYLAEVEPEIGVIAIAINNSP